MKTWSKYLYHLSLVTAILGVSVVHTYAQENETEQLEENLKILETTKIYGNATLGAGFSVNNYPGATFFVPAKIVPDTQSNPDAKLIFDLNVGIGLKKTVKLNDKNILLDMSIGFDREGKSTIKNATAEFDNWVLGLTASSFADLGSMPAITGGYANSTAYKDAKQIRWKQTINPSYSYAVSLEEAAKFDLNPEEKDKDKKKADPRKPNNDTPALAGHFRFNYPDKLGHLHIGALGRILNYYHTTTKKDYFAPAFGVNLGSRYNIIPEKTILNGSIVYGQGIGGYITDLSVLEDEVNTAYTTAKSAELSTIKAFGGYLGAEYRWTPEVRLAASGGALFTLNNDNRPNKASYKSGYYGALKVSYHPTEHFNFGISYLFGGRTNENKIHNQANRIHFESAFTF